MHFLTNIDKKMYLTKLKVNFFDADPAGIMFFANAFKFAHAAYEELIESSPFTKEHFYSGKIVVPIVHSEADYRKPVYPNSTLGIEITVPKISKSSFTLNYSLKDEKGEICVEVQTVHVIVDKATWQKTEIPEGLRKFLENLHGRK